MAEERELLNNSIRLIKVDKGNDAGYYKLEIGTDPETQVVICDTTIEQLLADLPKIFSTLIHTQVLIENPKRQRRNVHEGVDF